MLEGTRSALTRVFKSPKFSFQQFKTSLSKLFLSVWSFFRISFWSGKTFKFKKSLEPSNFENQTTYSKALCATQHCSFKHMALGHTYACSPRVCMQTKASLPSFPRSWTRWAATKALPARLLWSGPFSAVSPRDPWSLVCKTCEEKHWIWDFNKGANECLRLGNSTFGPQQSVALLSLAQSNQCADYCTTALSWTGSLNTGATEQDLQKLPSMPLKSSPSPREEPPFLHQGLRSASPAFCRADRDTLEGCVFQSWRGTFAAD